MKFVTVVGARPQFIKASVLSREIRKSHTEILVHTGQHYDQNMSDVFFKELGIAAPDFHLEIGSGSHGKQTGAMLGAIEDVLITEKPDRVIVYGDTNSTLAGALAASKLHIKLAHVEAGLRSNNRRMPEEINRILTDHMSDLLLCPTQTGVDNLLKEGISRGVYLAGDVMVNALLWALKQEESDPILEKLNLSPGRYILATVHRAENTDDLDRMRNILRAFEKLSDPLVWPVHPRTRKILETIDWQPAPHVRIINPLGYVAMAKLEKNARVILTDSGGVQKEAYWLGVPCVTLRDETEWVETVASGWNSLAGADLGGILKLVELAGATSSVKQKDMTPVNINRIIKLLTC